MLPLLNVLLILFGLPLVATALTVLAATCGCPELLRRPRPAPPVDVTSGWAAWA